MTKVEFIAKYQGKVIERQWMWFDHKSEIQDSFKEWEKEVLAEVESSWIVLKEND